MNSLDQQPRRGALHPTHSQCQYIWCLFCESKTRKCRGVIAQLGERLNGIQEVGGSIPPGSTTSLPFSCSDLEMSL